MAAPLAPARPGIRRTTALLGGLAAVGALAGCATGGASSPAPASTSAGSSAASALKDGTYEATGEYQSPGGLAKVGVSVTLKGGTITAVVVKPEAENPTARQYESKFASGVGAVVVGKPIEGLSVGAVSGSSLTSQGFERALDRIRTDAAA